MSGFYKGITASYFGISETIVHFVIYEFIKLKLAEYQSKRTLSSDELPSDSKLNFFQYMGAAATSKSFASIIAYPHGKTVLYSTLFYNTISLSFSLLSHRGCPNPTSRRRTQVSAFLSDHLSRLSRRRYTQWPLSRTVHSTAT